MKRKYRHNAVSDPIDPNLLHISPDYVTKTAAGALRPLGLCEGQPKFIGPFQISLLLAQIPFLLSLSLLSAQ